MLAAIRREPSGHFDGATETTPQKGTFLAARDVDDSGEGGTQFASTYVAYETLSDDDKALIVDLQVVHSFVAAQGARHSRPDRDGTHDVGPCADSGASVGVVEA